MTRPDLLALVQSVADAAARAVGATPARTQRSVHTHGPRFGDVAHGLPLTRRVVLAARAGAWNANGSHCGPASATGDRPEDAAAVLALRERVQRQRDERARMLAADEAALRVIDETARIYDAATVDEACGAVATAIGRAWMADDLRRHAGQVLGAGPWSRSEVLKVSVLGDVLDACDAILRRRAEVQP